jgi:D-alanyl-lipoteichoic acid acyltransferase DltB (MBOAT superfamily)
MLFNSWSFLPFIIAVLLLYYVLPFRWQNRMLLVASCVFYGAWDWRFLILLFGSTAIDFFVGRSIHASANPRARKRLLILSVVANLGILGFFKYFNFFTDSAVHLLNLLGLHVSPVVLAVGLPVGISFYTFHAMSYTIDIYRGKLEPVRNFWDYMLFVLYFPQLVAGPIARASALIPQVTNPRSIRLRQVLEGLWLMLWGFFKKMVVADNLAVIADRVFNAQDPGTGLQCLVGCYAFAYQIYCDFSGYTDIARGLGKIMGFELSLNFNQPYLARNPVDFWRRWHISLSTWLRDYLYIPLGGNRHGTLLTYRNLMLTMLLGGLWHGAAWNFVLWGAYHGALLAGHRLLFGARGAEDAEAKPGLAFGFLSWVVMFHLTCLGWLFFRASSLTQIGTILGRMASGLVLDEVVIGSLFLVVFLVALLWLVEVWLRNTDAPWTRWGWNVGLGPVAVSVLLAAIFFLTAGASKQFIYFQF